MRRRLTFFVRAGQKREGKGHGGGSGRPPSQGKRALQQKLR